MLLLDAVETEASEAAFSAPDIDAIPSMRSAAPSPSQQGTCAAL
jgi:hypothetical protein